MARPTREQRLVILERRAQVAKLYHGRMTVTDIAKTLKVSREVISQDLLAIRKSWRSYAIEEIADRVAEELADLDRIESQAQAGYERDQNPRFLELRLKVKERRARMLGLDAPTKVAATDPTGTIGYNPYANLSTDQLWQLIAELLTQEEHKHHEGSVFP